MGDRWIIADFAFTGSGATGPYYECIAVSKTSDPVAGGWYLYAVRADDAAHPWFPDYPKMGIWPDGLYMTANMFQGLSTFKEVRVWAFNRADLESGATLRSVVVDLNTSAYFSLLPSNLRGAAPPAGRENLLVSESQTAFAFQVFKFHVDIQRQRLDLHRPDERQPDVLHGRGLHRADAGESARHAARAHDDAGAVPQPQRHRVALGEPHRQDRRERSDRDPMGADQRHRRARSRRRRCSSRSTATSEATVSTGGWAASPSTRTGTWRSATASRAPLSTPTSATPAGWQATQ